jgi:hypothetical protein
MICSEEPTSQASANIFKAKGKTNTAKSSKIMASQPTTAGVLSTYIQSTKEYTKMTLKNHSFLSREKDRSFTRAQHIPETRSPAKILNVPYE